MEVYFAVGDGACWDWEKRTSRAVTGCRQAVGLDWGRAVIGLWQGCGRSVAGQWVGYTRATGGCDRATAGRWLGGGWTVVAKGAVGQPDEATHFFGMGLVGALCFFHFYMGKVKNTPIQRMGVRAAIE